MKRERRRIGQERPEEDAVGRATGAPPHNRGPADRNDNGDLASNRGLQREHSRKHTVFYLNGMLNELRRLSIAVDEPVLTYMIEMALLEADAAANKYRTGTEAEA